jgi:imidazolonepropionase-like amidohydrolase
VTPAKRTNAALLNAAGRLARVEPGKLADLIVTAENPIDHIGLFADGLKNVVLVIQGGVVVKDRLG